MKVEYDPTGQLSKIGQASNEIIYQVSKEEVESWKGKVFSYFHEVYRRTQREEYYYALTMINNLRSFIVQGWNMEACRHSNAAWDWSKIEGERTELEDWQLSLLSSWMCGRNQKEIMKTATSMVPELRRLHGVLSEKVGLGYSQEHFDKIINQVL